VEVVNYYEGARPAPDQGAFIRSEKKKHEGKPSWNVPNTPLKRSAEAPGSLIICGCTHFRCSKSMDWRKQNLGRTNKEVPTNRLKQVEGIEINADVSDLSCSRGCHGTAICIETVKPAIPNWKGTTRGRTFRNRERKTSWTTPKPCTIFSFMVGGVLYAVSNRILFWRISGRLSPKTIAQREST
jgi:hypothetical protein